MTRALVLGSGGYTGLAWETGVLSGLAAAGEDIASWDLVLGSSAGAYVGARLLAGRIEDTYRELAALDVPTERAAVSAGFQNSLAALLAIPGPGGRVAATIWTLGAAARRLAVAARRGGLPSLETAAAALYRFVHGESLSSAELRQLAAAVVGQRAEAVPHFEAYWAGRLAPDDEWPAGHLRIVAIDGLTGMRHVFESANGAPLSRAVAASTAIPGIVGAIEIGGREYFDPGTLDTTSADFASGHDEVLIIAPDHRLGELERSAAGLRAGGSRVTVIEPSDRAVFGERIQHLNVGRVPASAQMGRRDGLAAGA
ncbi:patatin-like phospholipase family protein [Sinomonas sp. G460-2]|uniref:patatin-like phospholipase family protein n=1 Tax=Sinomonas sp. G460-2 TaxID=3393464 RepID=UPI0039F02337